jgi:hypothetical protein
VFAHQPDRLRDLLEAIRDADNIDASRASVFQTIARLHFKYVGFLIGIGAVDGAKTALDTLRICR